MSEPKGVTLGMVALDLDEQADAMSEAIIPELLALTRQQAALVRAADRVVAAAQPALTALGALTVLAGNSGCNVDQPVAEYNALRAALDEFRAAGKP